MASPEPPESKPSLRLRFRGQAVDPRQSAAIRSRLHSWLASLPPAPIAAFSPLADEVDLLPLLGELPHHQWLLPRVQGSAMTFHSILSPRDLIPGAFGILEPVPGAPAVPAPNIPIFLCPGLAFSRRLERLGRGKGFYDRLLSQGSPQALRIGVCPDSRLLDRLPVEIHDLPMHFIATATAWLPHPPPASGP